MSAERSGEAVQRAADDEWSYTLHMSGSGTTLDAEEQNEAVRLLHEAVFEVTGKRVEPVRRGIGFVT